MNPVNQDPWYYNPGGSYTLQGNPITSADQTASALQGSSLVGPGDAGVTVQGAIGTAGVSAPTPYTTQLGAQTSVDPAQAAARAAADAAKAGRLRTEITDLVNSVKNIFNQRYGQVDAAAGEQVGKVNDQYSTQSQDLTGQITAENERVGAASAANGVFDSSYRSNNQDTVTKAGQTQIRDLGTELQDKINTIAQWVSQQKAGFDANKSSQDTILGRLGETTDLNELTSLRGQLENRITELQAGSADNNTAAQNAATLEAIAPSSARAVQLKTTLSQIIAGNADAGQKAAIGEKLIANAGLSPADQKALLDGFTGSLSAQDTKDQPQA